MHRTITATCLLFATSIALGDPVKISVAPGLFHDYYHIQFELTPDNCEPTVPITERRPKYTDSNEYVFTEGGLFEVFIRKTHFPIAAPYTNREFLILRMPWTDPSDPNATQFISEKRALYNEIQKMKTQSHGKVEIVVQLNPYVAVVKEQPLTLELTERNVFFRQAYGQYIDYIGPLRK